MVSDKNHNIIINYISDALTAATEFNVLNRNPHASPKKEIQITITTISYQRREPKCDKEKQKQQFLKNGNDDIHIDVQHIPYDSRNIVNVMYTADKIPLVEDFAKKKGKIIQKK